MSLKIKICGMRESVNISQVADLKPDLMGFIFYPLSPRYAGIQLNPESLKHFHPGIKKAGVFVNEEIDRIKEIILKYSLDIVQLHGNESPEFCRILFENDIPVIKTIHVRDRMDFKGFYPYIPFTNYFLFDTSTSLFGGSGYKFDWDVISGYDFPHPFFLSGGISPEDISQILEIRHPFLYGVDLNSRFEIEPGLKDVEMLKKFITGIRIKKI